jgi:glucosamine kinase
MRELNPTNVIAVDGGGTSCRIALRFNGARTELQTGPANVASNFDGAVRTIRAGLDTLAQQAGVDLGTICALPAYLGLAGVLGSGVATRVAGELPLARVRVEDDRIAALTGALAGLDGVVAGIGTGSFLGLRRGAQTRLIGGYGLNLGDEASGAWLGRRLLARSLHVLDGLAQPSPLTEAILADFGADAGAIVAFAGGATPEAFAAFAPRIVTAAQRGDAAANALMEAGAGYIAKGLVALGWKAGERLCLTGGVGPQYQSFLRPDIAASVRAPLGTGLDGALMLAARFAAEPSGERP